MVRVCRCSSLQLWLRAIFWISSDLLLATAESRSHDPIYNAVGSDHASAPVDLNRETSLIGGNFTAGVSGVKTNVLGKPLQACSKDGTAMTGFTRTGQCVDQGNDDEGSHHICIIMKSDFCTVTGQPDWCSEKMPCMGQSGDCSIGNWCVCQWAFASYLAAAGGCDKATVGVVCDSTNQVALKAYTESTDPTHKAALQCIESKCGVSYSAFTDPTTVF